MMVAAVAGVATVEAASLAEQPESCERAKRHVDSVLAEEKSRLSVDVPGRQEREAVEQLAHLAHASLCCRSRSPDLGRST